MSQGPTGGSRPIRVLHVIDQLRGGGAEVSLVEFLARSSRDSRFESEVVVLNGQPASVDVTQSLGLRAAIGPPGRRPRWADANLVRSAVSRFEPEIVHCSLFRSTFATSRATRSSTIPVLVTLTGLHYSVEDKRDATLKRRLGLETAHLLHRQALRRPGVSIHAVSEPVAAKAVELFGVEPGRLTVVPRGRPDPEERVTRDRGNVREELGIEPEAPTLIYVAREHPVKNHVALLKATAAIRPRFPDLRLLLVGERNQASEAIDDSIRELELDSTVIRLGHRDDVPNLLAASDVFVSTSISEGLPGAIVEALGSRLALIAFDVPGVRDAMGDDHPGLVAFPDHEQLVRRMIEVLEDPGRRMHMGSLGRQRFESQFQLDAYVDHMHDLYSRIVRSPAHAPDSAWADHRPNHG